MRLGEPQSLSGTFEEEKNTCPFPEYEPQNIQLAAYSQ